MSIDTYSTEPGAVTEDRGRVIAYVPLSRPEKQHATTGRGRSVTKPTAAGDDHELFASGRAADAWQRGEASRDDLLGPATALMLDLAGVGPGARVLDLAAGTGAQTLLAARRVGPTGAVLATDVAAPMLDRAAEEARLAGLDRVATRVMDAHELALDDARFDAAICRQGLMYLANLDQALAEVRRVLRLSAYAPRRRPANDRHQAPLFTPDGTG